jgi:hypothetical protein
MDINFKIGDSAAAFHRNWFTGRASMNLADQIFNLQSPWNPATHLEFSLTRIWRVDLPDHKVVIEKVRPLFFPAFRPNAYKIFVDDLLVAEASGT